MGKILRMEKHSVAGVRLGRDLEDRAKTTSVGSARNRSVILGIFPYLTSTKQNRDAHSVNSALLCTERLAVRPTKNWKYWWCMFCCHIEDFQAIGLRIPGHRAARKGTQSLGPMRSVQFLEETLRQLKIGKRKKVSVARCDSEQRFS